MDLAKCLQAYIKIQQSVHSPRCSLEKVWFLEGSQKEAGVIEVCSSDSWTTYAICLHSCQAYGNRQGQPLGTSIEQVVGKWTRTEWGWTYAVSRRKGPLIPPHIAEFLTLIFMLKNQGVSRHGAEDGGCVKKKWEKHSSVSFHVVWDSTWGVHWKTWLQLSSA